MQLPDLCHGKVYSVILCFRGCSFVGLCEQRQHEVTFRYFVYCKPRVKHTHTLVWVSLFYPDVMSVSLQNLGSQRRSVLVRMCLPCLMCCCCAAGRSRDMITKRMQLEDLLELQQGRHPVSSEVLISLTAFWKFVWVVLAKRLLLNFGFLEMDVPYQSQTTVNEWLQLDISIVLHNV